MHDRESHSRDNEHNAVRRRSRSLLPSDLLALQYVHDGQLSPDGRTAACVISRTVQDPAEEFFEIVLLDVLSGTSRKLNFQGRALNPIWSPDGKWLAFIGTQAGSSRLYIADAAKFESTALTPADRTVQGPLSWSPDGSTIAYTVITHRKTHGLRRITSRLFRAEGLGIIDHLTVGLHLTDLRSGSSRRLDIPGIAGVVQPAFSPCGRHLLFLGSGTPLAYAQLSGGLKLLSMDLRSGQVTELLGDRWFIAAAAWASSSDRVVVVGDFDSKLLMPFTRLWVVNADGSNPECRTTGLAANIGFPVHHDMPTWATSQTNMLALGSEEAYLTVVNHGCAEICKVALQGPVKWQTIASGPRSCLIMDANTKTSQLLFGVSDLHTPWDLYLLDLPTERETRLTHLNASVLSQWPELNANHLKFQSNDGMPLEGWYLARKDCTGPQPAVLFIHGGPMLSVGNVFRFDFHLLAANGYSVVFANFRGSAGYGESFMTAIVGDWGARAFPDHMAAVDSAVAQGWVDAHRIGVWGASHGGFATAWIVGHTQRFRAAIVESGVTDFSTLYYGSDVPDVFARDLGGRPDEIPDVYRSRSPLTYAPRCKTPTLLLHGEQDLRAPITEAEQFYRALHDAGCMTELVRVSEMTHMGDSIGPLTVRLAQNEALLDWFERYL